MKPSFQRCLVCRSPLLTHQKWLCSNCEPPRRQGWSGHCRQCSAPMLSEKDICCDCRGKTFDFSQIWAPFAYEGIATILVQLYKFQERFELAEFWAERLAEGVTQPWPLVPVPAQAQNRRLRGWDPVTLLCRKLSQLKQVPVKPLLRRGTTLIQKNLSREDRLLNLSGKISFHPGGQGPPQAVYLVDDVMTTGATLHECAKILRQNGVQEVRAVCCTCR